VSLSDKSVTYDATDSPKVTLARVGGIYEATIEVDGLAPDRTTTAEERRAGILSLEPPTVRTKTPARLIESGSRAVQAAAMVTPELGDTLTPGDLAMFHYRVARSLRVALRMIDEDV
jgi:hypothetical protein